VTVPSIVGAGHEVHGCWHWNHERHAEEMFARIRQVAASLDVLMTHAFPLSEVGAAFALQESGACGKVLLYPELPTG
jgi:threonine dehydrogenase-like Zn-dependent dehydrogenase